MIYRSSLSIYQLRKLEDAILREITSQKCYSEVAIDSFPFLRKGTETKYIVYFKLCTIHNIHRKRAY